MEMKCKKCGGEAVLEKKYTSYFRKSYELRYALCTECGAKGAYIFMSQGLAVERGKLALKTFNDIVEKSGGVIA